MRRAWVLICLLVPLGGCLQSPSDGQSPIAGPPKLVVNHGPDNLTEFYVHSSVGEINYTQITLRVENASLGVSETYVRNESYSLDVKTNHTAFEVNATVRDEDVVYTYEAELRVNVTRTPPDLTVDTDEADPSTSGFPYSTTLEQWKTEEP